MPVAKRKPLTMAEQVRERQVADRVARARKADPTFDARGVYTAKLRELADETGRDVGDLIDDWAERCGIRMYDAGTTVDDAESKAFEDVRSIVISQRKLAV